MICGVPFLPMAMDGGHGAMGGHGDDMEEASEGTKERQMVLAQLVEIVGFIGGFFLSF